MTEFMKFHILKSCILEFYGLKKYKATHLFSVGNMKYLSNRDGCMWYY